jgi:hypothetical protein
MKAIVAVLVLLALLVGANYSITGNVVAGGDDGTLGIFERLWDWFKGLFFEKVEERVGATAEVAIEILPGNIEDIRE